MRFRDNGPRSRWAPFSLLTAGGLYCLTLCQMVSADSKAAADYYVHSLPGQPDGPLLKMHAGHVEVAPEHNGNLFFWHFQNRHLANTHRTVLWLNGGPGCSSLDGALMEIGPYRLKDDAHLEYNDGSWDEFANLLFVDNPVGTGFSYVDTNNYVHELTTMADEMVIFFEKFFAMFPEYEENEIYISGESYAGQHIPYIAKAILERNAKPTVKNKWDLKGLLIGNGWIEPVEQSLAYLEYAYKSNVIIKGSDNAAKVETQLAVCKGDQKAANYSKISYPSCEKVLRDTLRLTVKDGKCVNMYDVRLVDSYPSCGMNWPPDLASITPYLHRKEVIKALHAEKKNPVGWSECNGAVGGALKNQKSRPSIEILPSIIEKVPVLLFSGDKDIICNHLGTENLIHNMEWGGGKGFEIEPGTWAPRRDWTFEDQPAGFYQEARNLTYVLFYNSSHMVPFDYARRTRDMLDRFMKVDIGTIGGKPTNSRIDGQKGLETSVGGHPNSTAAEQAAQEKLVAERWSAYYKSGFVALVVVIILTLGFAWYVWRDRRRRAGYQGLFGEGGSVPMRQAGGLRRDVEATDFDENELDDLRAGEGAEGRERYGLGGMSSDEEEEVKRNGRRVGRM